MPAKGKKKKKGDNFANLDAEQRREYLERRAAQEQEKIRKRAELLECFLKIKLNDERSKADLNDAKLNEKWRSTLRQSKMKTLFSELKISSQKNRELILYLDNIINSLIEFVEETHQQRKSASQKHLSFIHSLTSIHEEYLYLLTRVFRKQEVRLIKNETDSIQTINKTLNFHMNRLECVRKAAAFLTDEKNSEEILIMQNVIATTIVKLEEEYEAALKEEQTQFRDAWILLVTSLKTNGNETERFRQKNNSYSEKLNANLSLQIGIEQEIINMKTYINSGRFQNIQKDQIVFTKQNKYMEMKLKLYITLDVKQRYRLRELTKLSNYFSSLALQRLRNTASLGENIIKLINICQKLETTQDKNVPFFYQIFEKKSTFSDNIEKVSLPSTSEVESGIGTLSDSQISSELQETKTQVISKPKTADEMQEYSHLPQFALEKIRTLIMDETILQGIAKKMETPISANQPIPDDIMREAEIVWRNHEKISLMWIKVNNVQIQTFSLEKEVKDLETENKNLKSIIKENIMSTGLKL